MIIEEEKRSDFEARIKEVLNIYAWNVNPEIYENEVLIAQLADMVGWDKQSPLED